MTDAKRRRTDGAGDEPGNVVSRSEHLWLNDGNIIIRTTTAGPPRTHTLYKVHKFILSLHCGVFATLFESGPQDAFNVGSERYDGLPVMDLPDEDGDVENFLKALYYPEVTQRHLPTTGNLLQVSFPPTYSGILRLATKYDAAKLRDIVSRVLKMLWPTLMDDWHSRECKMDPALAIRLATDFNIPDVLPVAYYDLYRRYESGPPAENPEADCNPNLSLLDAEDLRKFILGRTQIRVLFIDTMFIPGDVILGNGGCTADVKRCKANMDRRLGVDKWDKERITGSDPVNWLHQWAVRAFRIPNADVCKSCRMRVWTHLDHICHELIWQRLPKFFAVEDVSEFWGQPE